MRSASGGPRVLLRRLRETMAEQVSAQERLDKIVVLIAANMVAEVCSVYVPRVDNTLELYATEGLNRDAVHRTVHGGRHCRRPRRAAGSDDAGIPSHGTWPRDTLRCAGGGAGSVADSA